jgi:hypothetical protein
MDFPFYPKHIEHRHGGKITEIGGISHRIGKPEDGRSTDHWFYVGTVVWTEGKASIGREIAPFELATDTEEGRQEINLLSRALMEYLADKGTWNERSGWSATVRKGVKS